MNPPPHEPRSDAQNGVGNEAPPDDVAVSDALPAAPGPSNRDVAAAHAAATREPDAKPAASPTAGDTATDGVNTADPLPRVVLIRAAVLMLVAFGAVVLVNVLRRDAFFRIEARTEIVDVALRPSRTSQLADLHWNVAGDSVLADDDVIFPFTGHIVPGAGARVAIRRVGTGPVYIEVHARSDTVPAAMLYADDAPVATARALLVLRGDPSDERTYTLAYFGAAGIGDIVSSGGAELLLDGTVSILGSTVVGDDRFVAATIPLRTGDQVHIAARAGCGRDPDGAPGVGVVRVDAAPGLRVVHEARGAALRVSRVGSAPHCFRPTLWSFLSADPLLAALLIFAAGVVIAVVQNLISYMLLDTRAFLRVTGRTARASVRLR